MNHKIAVTPGLMCALNLLSAKGFLDIQLFKGNKCPYLSEHNMKKHFVHAAAKTGFMLAVRFRETLVTDENLHAQRVRTSQHYRRNVV